MSIELREPRTPEEFQAYYELRWRILREPWGRPPESEKDEYEHAAFHIAAWAEGRVVGVGRVHFLDAGAAQIRFMAVMPDRQGGGIGSLILERLEAHASERGAGRIVLNARDRAVQFYARHGYRVVGESERLFESIDHWHMEKRLGVAAGAEV